MIFYPIINNPISPSRPLKPVSHKGGREGYRIDPQAQRWR
jgi:hypothetical protein